MKRKLKTLHNNLLRGGFCLVWMSAFIIAFYEFMYAESANSGSNEQTMFMIHTAFCIAVGVVAVLAHTHLMEKNRGT